MRPTHSSPSATVSIPVHINEPNVDRNSTCDRHPSAKAKFVASFLNGPVTLCGHCVNKHKQALYDAAITVRDL